MAVSNHIFVFLWMGLLFREFSEIIFLFLKVKKHHVFYNVWWPRSFVLRSLNDKSPPTSTIRQKKKERKSSKWGDDWVQQEHPGASLIQYNLATTFARLSVGELFRHLAPRLQRQRSWLMFWWDVKDNTTSVLIGQRLSCRLFAGKKIWHQSKNFTAAFLPQHLLLVCTVPLTSIALIIMQIIHLANLFLLHNDLQNVLNWLERWFWTF